MSDTLLIFLCSSAWMAPAVAAAYVIDRRRRNQTRR